MTSLLAFAWRKSQEPASDGMYDHETPGVSASSSADTLANQSSQDSMFDVPTPATPEGFRPRKSADEIRRELNLSPPSNAPSNGTSRWRTNATTATCLDSSTQCSGALPSFGCGSMLSPQVSNSSFYTQSSPSASRVAKSPNLKLGQAKTAVGALLAMSDAQDIVCNEEGMRQHHEDSILPPRFWLAEDRDIQSMDDDGIEFDGDDRRYESFQESASQYSQGSPMRDSYAATSFDNESTVHGSPSSNILRSSRSAYRSQNNGDIGQMRFPMKDMPLRRGNFGFHPVVDENMMVTRSADSELNISGISQSTKDIESLQSLVDNDDEDDDTFDDEAEQEQAQAEEYSYSRKVHKTSSHDFRDTLRLNRIHNQRRLQEDLLQSILERLQDTPVLVVEIMDATQPHTTSLKGCGLFMGFPMEDRDTMCQSLTKILNELRVTSQGSLFMPSDRSSTIGAIDEDLVQAISFCLAVVRAAIPPSEKSVKLQFSSTGIPEQGHRWKCVPGFRAALGFEEEPMSPEAARGGETDLFSLPSESENATPHTSNVSLPTTITSAFSPEKNHRQKLDSHGRNSLRSSLESILMLFDTMSQHLMDIVRSASLEMAPSSRSLEGLRRLYLEMQKIDSEDLKALIDSFELDLQPLKITHLVSGERKDSTKEAKEEWTEPRALVRSSGPLASQLVRQTMALPSIVVDINVVEEEEEDEEDDIRLFSPSTEDMNSIELTLGPVDDLRRTVGSFDSTFEREEREVEERDAPPAEPRRENPRKRTKPKRSMWRRRLSRKHKVAE